MTKIFLDIAGGTGQSRAISWARESPDHCVYALESEPEGIARLQDAGLPNLHVYPAPVPNVDSGTSPESVTLGTFIRNQGIAQIEQLGLGRHADALPLLRSAGGELHRVKSMFVELPSPVAPTPAVPPDLLRYVRERGFQLSAVNTRPDTGGATAVFRRWSRHPAVVLEGVSPRDAPVMDVHVPHAGWLRFPRGDVVGLRLRENAFEHLEQAFLWLYLHPGDTVLDGGAHVGLYSVIAARAVGETGRVIAVEPNPNCATFWRHNLARNRCTSAQCFELALADDVGEATLYAPAEDAAAFTSLSEAVLIDRELTSRQITVRTITLPALLLDCGVGRLTLLKLDVEGVEARVLRAALPLLESGRVATIMVELTELNARAAGSSTAEVRQILEGAGYTLCAFDATSCQLVPEPRQESYLYANRFAVWDIEETNARLRAASLRSQAIAADLITRHDLKEDLESDRAARLAVAEKAWQRIDTLTLQLDAASVERTKVQEGVTQLEARIAALTAERDAIGADCADQEKAAERLTERVTSLEEELCAARAELEKHLAATEQLRSVLADTNAQLTAVQSGLDARTQDLEAATAQHVETQARLARSEASRDELVDEVRQLERRRVDLEEGLAEAQRTVAEQARRLALGPLRRLIDDWRRRRGQ